MPPLAASDGPGPEDQPGQQGRCDRETERTRHAGHLHGIAMELPSVPGSIRPARRCRFPVRRRDTRRRALGDDGRPSPPSSRPTGGATDGDRTRLRAVRGTDLRLLRHAHRLGGRDPRRPASGAGCARRERPTDDELLEEFAELGSGGWRAGPYLRYREILGTLPARGRRRLRASRRTSPTWRPSPIRSANWPAFPDSVEALRRLHERFRLGVITNCDDDLFARSAARLADRRSTGS